MRNYSIILILTLVCFFSCGNPKEFQQYKQVQNGMWHKDSVIKFKYSAYDTLARNNVYVNLRNNKDYEFSNLFLIVGIEFPNTTTIVDTLEYEMADAQGNFLGTGFTDLKENKLEYKSNVIFPDTGAYTIRVQHAMRKNGQVDGIEYLDGITEVGLSIEKAITNE